MKSLIKVILPAILLASAGCMSWDEGWKGKFQKTAAGDAEKLYAAAVSLEKSADSGEKVKKLIAAYEKALAADPDNFMALSKAGESVYLYAYMYSNDPDEKEKYYLKCLKYCERAMYTNPGFRKLADQGKPVWEAAEALTIREMEPMFYWYVATGQYWSDCLNPVSQLLNFSWVGRANRILKKMTAIDPEWGYGRVHMTWAAFYAITPGFLGGDTEKSSLEFSRAIKDNPDAINNFYVRAKYLHIKNGDKNAFREDLNYVLSRDIKKLKYPYTWAAAYQYRSKELLNNIDNLF